ncbi:MAG TPA: hypothetical protein VFL85_04415 [Candidatus Saccharimonadales bacterium]|nr:hypothetical protein [Candidatus Saccharimonadales bacterium]
MAFESWGMERGDAPRSIEEISGEEINQAIRGLLRLADDVINGNYSTVSNEEARTVLGNAKEVLEAASVSDEAMNLMFEKGAEAIRLQGQKY